jgi:hypothetical protein
MAELEMLSVVALVEELLLRLVHEPKHHAA